MKKSVVIPLMALALLVPFGAVMGEEDRPAAVEEAPAGTYVYDNRASGLSMTIPGNRVENEKSGEVVYQAFLPDEGIALSILSKAYGQPYGMEKMKEQEKKAEQFLTESIARSGEKKLSLKKVKTGAGTALFAETTGQGKDGAFSVMRYLFLRQEGTAMISFTMKEGDRKKNDPVVKQLMDTLTFYIPMQKVNVKGTPYTYDIPASMKVDYDPPVAPDHVLVAGNRLLMTGVVALPISENREFSFLPSSLSHLSDGDKENVMAHFKSKLAGESTGRYVENVKFLFGSFHGRDGLRLDFDDQGDHNTSYIFVKDGKYISFDYIYNTKERDYAERVMERSLESISF